MTHMLKAQFPTRQIVSRWSIRILTPLFMAICTGALAGDNAQHDEASKFNLEKYMGTWYEIARHRSLAELGCENATATYAQHEADANRVHVVNSCDRLGHVPTRMEADLIAPDAAAPTRLVLEYRSGRHTYYSPYNIIRLDPDYRWAVVEGSHRHHLWILSRTPYLTPTTLYQIVTDLASHGYDTDHLHCTVQPHGADNLCRTVLD